VEMHERANPEFPSMQKERKMEREVFSTCLWPAQDFLNIFELNLTHVDCYHLKAACDGDQRGNNQC
jgi:hypothetical protein